MNIGDKVEWKSQAGGVSTIKRGTIINVVPPGVDPTTVIGKTAGYKLYHQPGGYRNGPSYLVADVTQIKTDSFGLRVEKKINRFLTYWPKLSHLVLVSEATSVQKAA